MKDWNWREAGWAIAAAAALAGLVLLTLPLWGRTVLGIAVAGGSFGWWKALSRRWTEDRNEQTIRMLNRHRHDWMNDFQVLFGYIQLKKFDKLPEQMDKLRAKALFDGYLAKLGIPQLIVYLFNYRSDSRGPSLDLEIEQELDLRELELNGNDVYELVRGIVEQFGDWASRLPEESGALSIGFDREEDVLLLDFVYRGTADPAVLKNGIRKCLRKFSGAFELREEEYGEDKAVVALALPFRI